MKSLGAMAFRLDFRNFEGIVHKNAGHQIIEFKSD